MSKPPSPPTKPGQSARPSSETDPVPAYPRAQLITALAAKMAELAARTGLGEADPDAELLEQCAIVNQVNGPLPKIDDWQRAMLRVTGIKPLTLAGLRAKVDIAVMVAGLKPEPGDELDNLDRVVIWLTLADVQELLDSIPA